MTNQAAYDHLVKLSKEIALLQSTLGLLEWDQETHMPHGGITLRSQQKELFSSMIHQKKTAPEYKKTLSSLIDLETGKINHQELSDEKKAALREWRRDYLHTSRLSEESVKALSKESSTATHVWAQSKEQNDFKRFLPHLEKVVSIVKTQAEELTYKEHPYDALLDLYEPGMTVAKLDPLFEQLKTALIPLVKTLSPSQDPAYFKSHIDPHKQKTFCKMLLKEMGIDFTHGRLDVTAHPFCMGLSPDDLRLTMHKGGDNLIGNIMATLHEGGHGLYEQGLLSENYGTPLGQSISMGIHESQSRFWETRIGLSKPFWECYYPKLQNDFPEVFSSLPLNTFYADISRATPSFIRIHSDELTYSLHIIIRYEVEKALLSGALDVSELPDFFNEKMTHYLGITPPTDREGCMQDIHWALGLFGYFPTYALGNLYAAQFFTTFEKDFPNWEEKIREGDLLFARNWLKEKIHCHGRLYTPEELIHKVTQSPLDPNHYTDYLTAKFN